MHFMKILQDIENGIVRYLCTSRAERRYRKALRLISNIL